MAGFDFSLLSSFYSAQASLSAVRSGAGSSFIGPRQPSATEQAGIEPPWSVNAERQTEEEERARALSGRSFVDDSVELYEDATPDDAKLFTMYVALDRLKAIADFAADNTTSAFRLTGLDKQFQTGLEEARAFLSASQFDQLQVLFAEERKKAESDAGVQRYVSEYQTRAVVTTAFDDPVPGLTGTEQFSLIAERANETVQVDFDLSEVSGPLNLDSLVSYFNTKLESAGLLTRFSREKIGEEDEDGVIAGTNFGLKITGASTEQVRFTAAVSEPAVYLAGVSGTGDSVAGQVIKLDDLASGAPNTVFTTRIEAEGETETKTLFNDIQITSETALPVVITDSAIDSEGNLYTVGTTEGDIGGGILKNESDVFLSKYDSTGNLVWTQLLGSNGSADGFAVAVDSDDNVIVAGSVTGDLTDNAIGGGKDSFVAKYAENGEALWTYQKAPTADDEAFGLATGANGEVYVVGRTQARLSSAQTYGGAGDGYVIALDRDGALTYERQIGGATADRAVSVAVASDGGLIVGSVEDGEGVIRKYDGADQASAALWEVNLGDLDGGTFGDIVVDGSDVYVSGYSKNGSLSAPIANAASGGDDGFVLKLTDNGATATTNFISYIGTAEEDRAASIAVNGGTLYVAGQTRGDLAGSGTPPTGTDGFLAELDSSGNLQWAYQYTGREGVAKPASIEVAANGSSVLDLLGLPTGKAIYTPDNSVIRGTSVREGDFFYVSVDGGTKRKVKIEAGESMRQLAFKIDNLLLLNGDADVKKGGGIDKLRITPKEGVKIELFRGEGDRDALAGLGLTPGVVFDDGFSVLDTDDDEDGDEIKTYALGVTDGLSLLDKKDAEAAAALLGDAMLVITRAHREINTDPALKALLEGNGTGGGQASPAVLAQLSNYQAGLARLSAGGGGSSSAGLFF
ncbi:MAG: hypothetical protein AAGC95_07040 [Pseudomonadota bacterium]